MNKAFLFFCVFCSALLLSGSLDCCWASDSTKVQKETDTPSSDEIADGTYTKYFENGFIDGSTYESENLLEILNLKNNTVYFNTHLEFFNGHRCELSGIAEINGNELIYHGHTLNDGQQCLFKITKNGDTLRFYENDICREGTCGSRGGYLNETFDIGSRRKIDDLKKITESPRFLEAVKFYNDQKNGTGR